MKNIQFLRKNSFSQDKQKSQWSFKRTHLEMCCRRLLHMIVVVVSVFSYSPFLIYTKFGKTLRLFIHLLPKVYEYCMYTTLHVPLRFQAAVSA